MPPYPAHLSPRNLMTQTHAMLEPLLYQAHACKDFPAQVLDLGRVLQSLCAEDADAALSTLYIGSDGRYTVAHPIHAAFLCEFVTRRLDMGKEERLPIIAAALTMNIAMLDLQETLWTQSEPVSESQRQGINQHPAKGQQLLQQLGVTDPVWLDAVLHHHNYENPETSTGVTLGARIISLADMYAAMIFGRAYREATLPHAAMREIFTSRGRRIDPILSSFFIKETTSHPPGVMVRLVNGEIAVVVRRSKGRTLPLAYSIRDPNGNALAQPMQRDCNDENYTIVEIISVTPDLKADRERLYGAI